MLQTADNFLKYGDDARAIARAKQRYEEALVAAEEAGNESLIKQARLRLADLESKPDE